MAAASESALRKRQGAASVLPTIALAVSLLALSVVPVSAAHACTKSAHPDCNARYCREGEEHYHEEYSKQGDRQYCETHTKTPAGEGCHYYHVTWPETLCWIFEDAASAPLLA